MPGQTLAGRDRKLRILSELIGDVRERGAAIVVLGEAGIGKSSLPRAAAEAGRAASLEILLTTGIEAEAQLPFAGLHQLLRPVLGTAGELPAAQRRALAAAFGTEDGRQPEPFMIALAALNLLAEVAAGRPLLLIADDVQWLDQPSQDALTFIARRVSADPIVVIGSVRKGYDIAFAAAGLPELDVQGLDDVSARAVLAEHGGDLSYASQQRILRAAFGNPLALVELPAALRAVPGRQLDALPLTARLERAFAARIADLPPLTRDTVLIAAVDDSDELAEILAGAAQLTGQPVGVEVLQHAAAAGLIQIDDLHVHFRHPLVRSGVLQQETVKRRYAANAALAEVLAGQPYRRTWHRVTEKLVPVFTTGELTTLEQACAGRTFAQRRDTAIIAVFRATGIRLAELAGLRYDPGDPRRSDIDLWQREITVRGKGGKDRTVRIGHQAARSLDRYLRARSRHAQAWRPQLWLGAGSREPLTAAGIYQMIARRGRQCGVDAYPHRFRHHFSRTWLDRGGPEGDLMELNGWTSPQMLRRYGASARSARARRTYDRIMTDT